MSETSARSEVIEILERSTPTGDFTVAEVVEKARAEIPDALLHRWAEEEIYTFLSNELRAYFHSQRSRARATIRRGGEIALTDDGSGALSIEAIYSNPVWVGGVRRPLGDLTGKDLRLAAADYERQGNELLFWAGVYRKLARKVGSKTVREVIDANNLRMLIGG